jgi:hypothetical protein
VRAFLRTLLYQLNRFVVQSMGMSSCAHDVGKEEDIRSEVSAAQIIYILSA